MRFLVHVCVAEWILGKTNIAFMSGPEHKALRKSFLALFTRKALGLYVLKQDDVIRKHFNEWMQVGGRRVRGAHGAREVISEGAQGRGTDGQLTSGVTCCSCQIAADRGPSRDPALHSRPERLHQPGGVRGSLPGRSHGESLGPRHVG